MADLSKAQMHHGKAGLALRKGDHKAAAHHFGHALAALRVGGASMGEAPARPAPVPKPIGMVSKKQGPDGTIDPTDNGTPGLTGPGRSVSLSLRGRLAKFGKK